jgi:hypothetical protein
VVGITFALYTEQTGAPLWQQTRNVTVPATTPLCRRRSCSPASKRTGSVSKSRGNLSSRGCC